MSVKINRPVITCRSVTIFGYIKMWAITRKFGNFEESNGRPHNWWVINIFENFLTSKTVKVNPLSPTFANICSLIYSTYHLTDDPVWQNFFHVLVRIVLRPFSRSWMSDPKLTSKETILQFDIGKMNLKLPIFSNFYPIIPEIISKSESISS